MQFEDIKRGLVKDLLADLLRSPHNIAHLEPFILHATSYLKKFDRADAPSVGLSANLKEVENMMAVAV